MPDAEPGNDAVARRALAISADLAAAGPGEKAAARRMDAEGAPVFWRQVARLGIHPRDEQDWRHITRLIALMTPATALASIHDGGKPLGGALAEAGLSEQRLARLLAIRGPARQDALERAIRMLARTGAGRGLDVVSLARFALDRDGNATARSYYRHLDHQTREAPPDE